MEIETVPGSGMAMKLELVLGLGCDGRGSTGVTGNKL